MGVLCCVDVFSRKVYACLITTVSAKIIIECFKTIFEKTKPKRIRTDLGGEFKSKATKAFLQNYCERVIYTLKSKLACYLVHYNTHVWKSVFL